MGNLVRLVSLQARSLVWGLVGRGCGGARLAGAVVLAVALAGAAASYLFAVGSALAQMGLAGAIPAVAALVGSLAGVAFAFMKANGTLFGASDYDFVAALPVPTGVVVLARTATLYGSAVVLSALTAVPLYAAYFSVVPLDAGALLSAVVGSAMAPLAPVSAAVLAAYAVSAAAARFRHAGAAYLLLSVVLVVGVAAGSVALGPALGGAGNGDALVAAGDLAGALGAAVTSAWPPAGWLADAVAHGSWASLALLAGVSVGAAAVTVALVARWYPQLTGALVAHGGGRGRVAKIRLARGSSATRALVTKELRRIASMPAYALNCCVGLVLMVVLAGALAVFSPEELLAGGVVNGVSLTPGQAEALGSAIRAALPWAFGFCAATALTAAPSVSLEGRAAWLMATLPLSRRTVLGAKLLANLLLGGIAIVVSEVALLLGDRVGVACALECAVVATGMLVGLASLTLALDVRRPNFGFTNPTEVIKRGLPVMVGVLGGLLVVGACGVAAVWLAGSPVPWATHVLNVAAPAAIVLVGLLTLTKGSHPRQFRS